MSGGLYTAGKEEGVAAGVFFLVFKGLCGRAFRIVPLMLMRTVP
jgi:hypothetical protein